MEIREEATAQAPAARQGEQGKRYAPKSSENGLPTCSLVSARLKASAGRIVVPSWLSFCVYCAREVFHGGYNFKRSRARSLRWPRFLRLCSLPTPL